MLVKFDEIPRDIQSISLRFASLSYIRCSTGLKINGKLAGSSYCLSFAHLHWVVACADTQVAKSFPFSRLKKVFSGL